MKSSTALHLAFSLIAIGLAASFLAAPAQAQLPGGGLNCSFYSRPGCDFSYVLDASPPEAPNTTFCCVFEGPNCCLPGSSACNGNTRVGPCWLSLPPDLSTEGASSPATPGSCDPQQATLAIDHQVDSEPTTAIDTPEAPAPTRSAPAVETKVEAKR